MGAKVSIILPSLNVGNYIEECILSAVRQTLKDIEIICVDAGSTDGTKEILEKYAGIDPRIKLIDSDRRSYGYQVNRGIDAATGKYTAILETDDFADAQMYQRLYEAAEKYSVDYVGVQYASFGDLCDGGRGYLKRRTNRDFNKVYCKEDIKEIAVLDDQPWSGIFNREFLNQNNIRMHETDGAAFQDVGFMQLVKWRAQRVLYIEDALYYYRTDRLEASTKQPAALKYLYQEYTWLLGEAGLLDKTEKTLFYYVMCDRFVSWVDFTSRSVGYDPDSPYLSEYMPWFKRVILEAMEEGILTEGLFRNGFWDKLQAVLGAAPAYIKRLEEADQREKACHQEILERIGTGQVVLFGCGLWGESALRFLDSHHRPASAICDNDRAFWGSSYGSAEILSPEQAFAKYRDAFYLIANKNHSEAMKNQLLKLGVLSDRIFVYEKVSL